MSKAAFSLLLGLSLFLLAACGKSSREEPLFKVDEAKVPKPTDLSGNVAMVEKHLKLSIQVPSPAWSLKISEVWVVGEELWVLADLKEAEGTFAQVMTEASDTLTLQAPNLEPVYYVIGLTGGWTPGSSTIKLIANRSQIQAGLNVGFPIWPKP